MVLITAICLVKKHSYFILSENGLKQFMKIINTTLLNEIWDLRFCIYKRCWYIILKQYIRVLYTKIITCGVKRPPSCCRDTPTKHMHCNIKLPSYIGYFYPRNRLVTQLACMTIIVSGIKIIFNCVTLFV